MAVDLLAFLDMARDRVGQAVEAPQLRARPTPGAVRPPYVLLLMAPPDRASERFAGVSSLRDGLLATEVGATSAVVVTSPNHIRRAVADFIVAVRRSSAR